MELNKEQRAEAVRSIERYWRENFDETIGNLAAGSLLSFFVEELGPLIYNQAVADVQERLMMRVQELDIEFHEDAFQYWSRRRDSGPGRK